MVLDTIASYHGPVSRLVQSQKWEVADSSVDLRW